MNKKDFHDLLIKAMDGDQFAFEQLIELYQPLINKYSTFQGNLDEDCRQYILMHIALNLRKFQI